MELHENLQPRPEPSHPDPVAELKDRARHAVMRDLGTSSMMIRSGSLGRKPPLIRLAEMNNLVGTNT
jgi:hypothetical protein